MLGITTAVSAAPFQNGGFESPGLPFWQTLRAIYSGSTAITGWVVAGAPVTYANASADLSVPPVEGDYHLIFNGGDSTPGSFISQTFNTVVGARYTVTFQVGRLGDENARLSIKASALSNLGETLAWSEVAPGPSGYQRYQIAFIAATPTSTVRFLDTSIDTAAADVMLDNVEVTQVTTGIAGTYSGLFYQWDAIRHETAGLLTLSVRDGGACSGTLRFGGNTVKVAGKFVDGLAQITCSRVQFGKSDVQLDLHLANGKITGKVQGLDWSSDVTADRSPFSDAHPARAFEGAYTMVIPGYNNASIRPVGYGCGTLTVAPKGTIKLSGAVADGMTLNQSAVVSQNGHYALYVPLYPTKLVVTNTADAMSVTTSTQFKGALIGWMTIGANGLVGNVNWTKTGWTNAVYPKGFTNIAAVVSSRYTVPATNNIRAFAEESDITFAAGNIPMPFTLGVTLSTNNVATVVESDWRARLSLNALNGGFSGSFYSGAKRIFYRGVVLQRQKVGAGFFVGSDQSGKVWLQGY